MKKVTICKCVSRNFIPRQGVLDLIKNLTTNGIEVQTIDDLCHLTISDTQRLNSISKGAVVACTPRAVEWLFKMQGIEPQGELYDLRNDSANEITDKMELELILQQSKEFIFEPQELSPKSDDQPLAASPEAWFPVIDRSRCSDCGQCFDFCLFGVYSLDSIGSVRVTNPRKCKNDCPACARVCPQKAIIFPKYPFSPINGGLMEEEPTAIALDTKALFADDLASKLAARRERAAFLLRK